MTPKPMTPNQRTEKRAAHKKAREAALNNPDVDEGEKGRIRTGELLVDYVEQSHPKTKELAFKGTGLPLDPHNKGAGGSAIVTYVNDHPELFPCIARIREDGEWTSSILDPRVEDEAAKYRTKPSAAAHKKAQVIYDGADKPRKKTIDKTLDELEVGSAVVHDKRKQQRALESGSTTAAPTLATKTKERA